MAIFPRLKAVFVHIPKCAGTSIECALLVQNDTPDCPRGKEALFVPRWARENRVARPEKGDLAFEHDMARIDIPWLFLALAWLLAGLVFWLPEKRRKPAKRTLCDVLFRHVMNRRRYAALFDYLFVFPQHWRASTYCIMAPPLDDYALFAVCRNPYDRLMSEFLYRFKMDALRATPSHLYSCDSAGFDRFVLEHVEPLFRANRLHHQCHLAPQSSFVCGERVTIVRFEQLPSALVPLGIETLGHLNEHPAEHFSASPLARVAIARIYAEDFRRFGYLDAA